MKKIINIFVLIILTVNFSYSQEEGDVFHSELEKQSFQSLDPVLLFVAANADATHDKYSEYEADLSKLVEKLQRKQDKLSSTRLLDKTFYLGHRKKLDWYEQYSDFQQLFESGKYDCVTGTAFYAMLLDRLGYDYTIYEFDYHVFLVAQVGEDSILIESTDPLDGLVTDQKEIARRINLYGKGVDPRAEELSPVSSQQDQSSHHVNNKISLTELAGLQYFNLSVKAFHEHDIEKARALISKAEILYPSYRIKEVNKIFQNERRLATN